MRHVDSLLVLLFPAVSEDARSGSSVMPSSAAGPHLELTIDVARAATHGIGAHSGSSVTFSFAYSLHSEIVTCYC